MKHYAPFIHLFTHAFSYRMFNSLLITLLKRLQIAQPIQQPFKKQHFKLCSIYKVNRSKLHFQIFNKVKSK